MGDSRRYANYQLKDDLDALADQFDTFMEQYEIDMRGDKSLQEGNHGVIGTVREIRAEQDCHQLQLDTLKHAVFGDDNDPENKPGVIQMAKANKDAIEGYNKALNKLAWMVISALLGGGGLGVLLVRVLNAATIVP